MYLEWEGEWRWQEWKKETWTWQPAGAQGENREGPLLESKGEKTPERIREVRETKATKRGEDIQNWREDKSSAGADRQKNREDERERPIHGVQYNRPKQSRGFILTFVTTITPKTHRGCWRLLVDFPWCWIDLCRSSRLVRSNCTTHQWEWWTVCLTCSWDGKCPCLVDEFEWRADHRKWKDLDNWPIHDQQWQL